MCENDPPLDKPMCVKWCLAGALTYEEHEVEVEDEEEAKPRQIDRGIEALVDKYGLEKVVDALSRKSTSTQT
jgi:benzoyl-CoA reductase subunit BamC